jgi:hypothetical protein
LPPPDALPPGTFAFGVFGDGPYRMWEEGRFRRVIEDVNRADLAWLIHIGDILWYPCSEAAFEDRLRSMNSVRHPVIYIPGDNEWTDCHEPIAGGYDPLERLASLRRIFFANPHRSLGGRMLELESQADSLAFSEFVKKLKEDLEEVLKVILLPDVPSPDAVWVQDDFKTGLQRPETLHAIESAIPAMELAARHRRVGAGGGLL